MTELDDPPTPTRPELTGPIYVAGPMTGLPDFNIQAFKDAEQWLLANYPGVEIHSPHNNSFKEGAPGSKPYGFYFRAGLAQLTMCQSAVFLTGWPKSKGAVEEYRCAELMGIDRFHMAKLGEHVGLVKMEMSLFA